MLNFICWLLLLIGSETAQSVSTVGNSTELKDGIYTGSSRSQYIYEPYVGTATLTIEKQKIVKVEFQIKDTLKNEVFGSDYEQHYPDNEVYRQQCRNDWKGIQLYKQELIEKQDINQVDAVTGATWSNNIFKASVKKALGKK